MSNIIDMRYMLPSAKAFDQLLSFDMSNVDDMSSMFLNVEAFNQPLLYFSAEKVEDMDSIFAGADAFHPPETIAHLEARSPAVTTAARHGTDGNGT